ASAPAVVNSFRLDAGITDLAGLRSYSTLPVSMFSTITPQWAFSHLLASKMASRRWASGVVVWPHSNPGDTSRPVRNNPLKWFLILDNLSGRINQGCRCD